MYLHLLVNNLAQLKPWEELTLEGNLALLRLGWEPQDERALNWLCSKNPPWGAVSVAWKPCLHPPGGGHSWGSELETVSTSVLHSRSPSPRQAPAQSEERGRSRKIYMRACARTHTYTAIPRSQAHSIYQFPFLLWIHITLSFCLEYWSPIFTSINHTFFKLCPENNFTLIHLAWSSTFSTQLHNKYSWSVCVSYKALILSQYPFRLLYSLQSAFCFVLFFKPLVHPHENSKGSAF